MTDTPAKHSKRRPVRLLVVLAALLALGGWWWLSRPPAFRLVSTVSLPTKSLNGYAIRGAHILVTTVNTSGVAHWEGWACPATVQCLDETGRERWAITVPASDSGVGTLLSPNIVTVPPNIRTITFSPNGRMVAAVMPIGTQVCAITWRDGKKVGQVFIPAARFGKATGLLDLASHLMDDGRVLLYVRNTARSPLFLIQGNRLIASGEHRSPFPPGADLSERHISPDLRRLTYSEDIAVGITSRFRLASGTIIVSDGIITVRQRALGTFADNLCQQLSDGRLVLFDGTLLDVTGKHVGTVAMTIPDPNDRFSSSRPLVSSTVVAQRTGTQVRLHSVSRGDAWSLPPRVEVAQIVGDRYVLASPPPGDGALQRRLKYLAEGIPFLRDQARYIGIPQPLHLYERPGRIRGVLPMTQPFPGAFKPRPTYMLYKVGTDWYKVEKVTLVESQRRLWLTATPESGGGQALLGFTWR